MKLLFITPDIKSSRDIGSLKRFLSVKNLTVPVLAAYIPEDIQLDICYGNPENNNFNILNYDIIAISFSTASAPKAYSIADKIRNTKKVGKRSYVIGGGIHATIMPNEAIQHFDAIGTGSGEKTLPQIINDIKKKNLKNEPYKGDMSWLKNRKLPKRQIFQSKILQYPIDTIQTAIGCHYNCSYCLPGAIYNKPATFSIDSVIKDIQSTESKIIGFIDDNIFQNISRAKELFKRMNSLNKEFFIQTPWNITKDKELVKLMINAGCKGVYIGTDSIIEKSLIEVNAKQKIKFIKNPNEYLKPLYDQGIWIELGFIFGFDSDDKNVFDKTLEFTQNTKINSISPHILTPYPKTNLYKNLASQDRLLESSWDQYDTKHVTYQPKNMTPHELQEGYNYFRKKSYNLTNILNRSLKSNMLIVTSIGNLIEKILYNPT